MEDTEEVTDAQGNTRRRPRAHIPKTLLKMLPMLEYNPAVPLNNTGRTSLGRTSLTRQSANRSSSVGRTAAAAAAAAGGAAPSSAAALLLAPPQAAALASVAEGDPPGEVQLSSVSSFARRGAAAMSSVAASAAAASAAVVAVFDPLSETEEGDCCAICLMEFEEGETLQLLPCKHAYHPQCIEQ